MKVNPQTQKYSRSHVGQISFRTSPVSGPPEGRIAIVTDVGSEMRWTRQRWVRKAVAGRVLPVSDRPARRRPAFQRLRHMSAGRTRPPELAWRKVAAYGKSVSFWHPLLMSSRRRFLRPNRVLQNRQSAGDGDKNEFVAGESAP